MDLVIDVHSSIAQGEILYSQVHGCFYLKHQVRSDIQGCVEIKGEESVKLKKQIDTSLHFTDKELYLACVGCVANGFLSIGTASTLWVVAREVTQEKLSLQRSNDS
mgnify:CR=1 FL=1